jgi:hypothetical protein
MNMPASPSPMSRSTPKVIALVLVSLCLAWLLRQYDAAALRLIDSMSTVDYIQHQRDLHSHSVYLHFLTCLICGGFFFGTIEFVAYMIANLSGRKN